MYIYNIYREREREREKERALVYRQSLNTLTTQN